MNYTKTNMISELLLVLAIGLLVVAMTVVGGLPTQKQAKAEPSISAIREVNHVQAD
jgi:hypothetical protein